MSANHDVQSLHRRTAGELRALLDSREISAVDLTHACLNSIEENDSKVLAWTYLSPELALQQAVEADRALARGAAGALCGIPVGIKDIFNTRDMPTQMGSPIWKDFTPGNDARVVYDLRRGGGVILGKTVTAEFAVHAPGPTRNPHRLDFIPGTSSSGSAVAVAAHMVPLAMGTQTAGSIIRPASYCGIYGFKPSFGLLPRTGMLKTTDSLDTVGFFARSCEDLRLVFDVVRVKGVDYPISHAALSDVQRQMPAGRPWRVGLIHGPKWSHAEAYARAALDSWAERLACLPNVTVESAVLPNSFSQAHDVHGTIYDKALAYYFKEEFSSQTLVSNIMYDIVQRGNAITAAEYQNAQGAQYALAHQLDDLFNRGYDVLLDLSTGGEALRGLETVDRPDNCLIWTLCGNPSLNLPVFCGPAGLPFGAQIIARRYNDYLLLNFVRFLQQGGLVGEGTNPEPQYRED